LFKAALSGVLFSPTSFFDTTPMGRIISRLSKDQDTIDQELSLTLYQLLSSFMNVLGTVGLVFYTFPLLGIIFAPLGVLYYMAATYYRRTSVETKRLDSLMRSALYASYTGTFFASQGRTKLIDLQSLSRACPRFGLTASRNGSSVPRTTDWTWRTEHTTCSSFPTSVDTTGLTRCA
jgi:ABC-type multidrug transport system fused ATPase/permease subunit